MNTRKIVIVLFFFGKLPWYFKLFLKSCGTNPFVDFLFFTDNSPADFDVPANVKFIFFRLEDFNALAAQKLNLPIAIEKGYKVCDLRPAFGIIFSDYLKDYDFWGYSDIDIILGRIRAFMTDDILDAYDIFCVKDEYPTGYFTLLRNTDEINNLFRKSKDYEMVFLAQNNYLFEECGGYYTEVCTGINILDTDCPFETFYHVIEKEKQHVRTLFDYFVIERTPGKLKWDNGLLSYRGEFEAMLYHLSDYKVNLFTRKKMWKSIPDCYYIDKYNLRKSSAVFPAAILFWTDKAHPFLLQKARAFLISFFGNLFPMNSTALKPGNYYYMNEALVAKREKNKTYLVFPHMDNRYRLLRFPFTDRYFFNLHTRNLYRLDGKNLIEIFKDGNIISYSFANDTI
jgi:hypothetical protein